MGNLLPLAFGRTNLLSFRPGKPAPRSGKILDAWLATDGTVFTLRTTHEDDGGLIQELVRGLSLRSRYYRFFYAMHELPAEILLRFTHNDLHGALSMIVVIQRNGRDEAIAMAQYAAGIAPGCAEFAIVVADEWHRSGLGRRLMKALVCIARAAGVERLEGDILAENIAMQRLALNTEFELEMHPDDPNLYRAVKTLRSMPEQDCAMLAQGTRNTMAVSCM